MTWYQKFLLLLIIVLSVVAFCTPTVYVIAGPPEGDNISVTILCTPDVAGLPFELILIYVSDNVIDVEWEKPASANNTMVRVKYSGYPETRDDGYLLYYGQDDNCTDQNVNLNETFSLVYYRAWTENVTELWSPHYASASIGGESVDVLAENVGIAASVLQLICYGVAALGLAVLAYWRKEFWLYLFAGGGLIFYGYFFAESIIAIGVIIALIGAYTSWRAIRMMI